MFVQKSAYISVKTLLILNKLSSRKTVPVWTGAILALTYVAPPPLDLHPQPCWAPPQLPGYHSAHQRSPPLPCWPCLHLQVINIFLYPCSCTSLEFNYQQNTWTIYMYWLKCKCKIPSAVFFSSVFSREFVTSFLATTDVESGLNALIVSAVVYK